MAVECRRPGPDLLQGRLNGIKQGAIQHAGIQAGVIHVRREDVPPAKNQLIERSERHEFLDGRNAMFGALAEANRAHLG